MASPSDRDNHLVHVFDLLDRLLTFQSKDEFEATDPALRALNVPQVVPFFHSLVLERSTITFCCFALNRITFCE
jgi:hypothetical protein